MNKNKITNIVTVIMIAVIMLFVGMIGLDHQAEASPGFAPTPVANLVNSGDATNITFLSQTAITADQDTAGKQLPEFEWCDVQYLITNGTHEAVTVNTTTLTIQFSNDNSNWVQGPALVSNSASDTAVTDLTRFNTFGRYVGFDVNVTNSNPVTVTLLGVCK